MGVVGNPFRLQGREKGGPMQTHIGPCEEGLQVSGSLWSEGSAWDWGCCPFPLFTLGLQDRRAGQGGSLLLC